MNALLLLMIVCPLLGSGVVALVAATAFAVAWVPRLCLRRRSRSLRAVPAG